MITISTSCCICRKLLKTGELIQAFLRSPDDPSGSWTTPTALTAGFIERSKVNRDNIQRRHATCGGNPNAIISTARS